MIIFCYCVRLSYSHSVCSFICQGTSARRHRNDFFDLRVKLPSVTTSRNTPRQKQSR